MDFVGTVLADTEDTWSQIFPTAIGTTICSTEVGDVFRGDQSGCGTCSVCNGAVLMSSRSEGVYRHRFL